MIYERSQASTMLVGALFRVRAVFGGPTASRRSFPD